ncbi:hypothetical protein [Blastococcus sp. PRF04-17]|uniref:hypothetical protein n=1 Tax=Blastococcus sp. PRF04-17 TaxID=2933797 RepID=UPI001FF1DB6E|nr:hypothetical protein [Blastococcus sp. PRF04-17]UOY01181.1 hypothetical protein MVA48_19840 [Blastococcus sp. PRF04-17]
MTSPTLLVRAAQGVRWPLLVFLLWRSVQGLLVVAFGGDLRMMMHSWDGAWYLSILRQGYVAPAGGYGEESNLAFFPGLVWATDAVRLVVGSETAATLLVANGLALGAFVAVWGAVRAWQGEDAARRVTVLLALFPTSYYLWMYYSEGLLVLATAAAAWAARRDRHNAATAFLAVASTARLVGVAVGPALALARVLRLRRVDSVSIRYVLGSAAGLGAVMVRQFAEAGDPLGFLHAGEAWGREFAGPWTPLHDAAWAIGSALPVVEDDVLLDAAGIVLVGCLLLLMWRGRRRDEWPLESKILATVLWSIPVCSRLIGGQLRYMLACWPALLVVADAWPRLSLRVRALVVGGSVGVTLLLLHHVSHLIYTG